MASPEGPPSALSTVASPVRSLLQRASGNTTVANHCWERCLAGNHTGTDIPPPISLGTTLSASHRCTQPGKKQSVHCPASYRQPWCSAAPSDIRHEASYCTHQKAKAPRLVASRVPEAANPDSTQAQVGRCVSHLDLWIALHARRGSEVQAHKLHAS
jgi:hypothetical protein